MTQLGDKFDSAQPHVLRCRISQKKAAVALKLDVADVVVLSYIGNDTYGSVATPVNSLIGLWGCHGACAFSQMTITPGDSLPFECHTPAQ